MDGIVNPFHEAVFLTGPTASGKSGVGVELAKLIGAEIIALDSMTLYRGMDIGTAKPSLEERGGVPHHLIDVLDPAEAASVADYRTWAVSKADEIRTRGREVLFVGGTALYLKALIRGLFEGPGGDDLIRSRLEAEAARVGPAALMVRLGEIDPPTASRLHSNDLRRIIRALEVFELTGLPISRFQTDHDRPAPADVRVFALDRPRAELHERINRRVIDMFSAGLIEETQRLTTPPRTLGPTAAQAVGYREVLQHIEGRVSVEEAVKLIQARTRQFAKRQSTWFRGLGEVRLFRVERDSDPRRIAERLAELVSGGSSSVPD